MKIKILEFFTPYDFENIKLALDIHYPAIIEVKFLIDAKDAERDSKYADDYQGWIEWSADSLFKHEGDTHLLNAIYLESNSWTKLNYAMKVRISEFEEKEYVERVLRVRDDLTEQEVINTFNAARKK